MASAVLLPLSGGGKIWSRAARARALLWSQSRRLATHLGERPVPPLAVLLKGLRLHHLPTVAAHHQIDVVVRRAVAIRVHICRGAHRTEFKWNTLLDTWAWSDAAPCHSPSFLRVMVSERFLPYLLLSSTLDPAAWKAKNSQHEILGLGIPSASSKKQGYWHVGVALSYPDKTCLWKLLPSYIHLQKDAIVIRPSRSCWLLSFAVSKLDKSFLSGVVVFGVTAADRLTLPVHSPVHR